MLGEAILCWLNSWADLGWWYGFCKCFDNRPFSECVRRMCISQQPLPLPLRLPLLLPLATALALALPPPLPLQLHEPAITSPLHPQLHLNTSTTTTTTRLPRPLPLTPSPQGFGVSGLACFGFWLRFGPRKKRSPRQLCSQSRCAGQGGHSQRFQ